MSKTPLTLFKSFHNSLKQNLLPTCKIPQYCVSIRTSIIIINLCHIHLFTYYAVSNYVLFHFVFHFLVHKAYLCDEWMNEWIPILSFLGLLIPDRYSKYSIYSKYSVSCSIVCILITSHVRIKQWTTELDNLPYNCTEVKMIDSTQKQKVGKFLILYIIRWHAVTCMCLQISHFFPSFLKNSWNNITLYSKQKLGPILWQSCVLKGMKYTIRRERKSREYR